MNGKRFAAALVLMACLAGASAGSGQESDLAGLRRQIRDLLPGLKACDDEATVAFVRDFAPAWERHMKKDPGVWDKDLFLDVAYGYYFVGRLAECEEHLQSVLSATGALTARAELLYALLLRAQRRYSRSLAEAQFLVQSVVPDGVEGLAPPDRRLYLLARGDAALHCGDAAAAEQDFERVLALEPDALSAAEAKGALADAARVRLMLDGTGCSRAALRALEGTDVELACLGMTARDKDLANWSLEVLEDRLGPSLKEHISTVIMPQVAHDDLRERLGAIVAGWEEKKEPE